MSERAASSKLESLRKQGDVVHHKRSPRTAHDGRFRTFKLSKGLKIEKAVKGKH